MNGAVSNGTFSLYSGGRQRIFAMHLTEPPGLSRGARSWGVFSVTPSGPFRKRWPSNTGELVMLKILTVVAASFALLSAAAAADLPRKEPPPPVAPVGKAPIGKFPVPVVSKG